jgi:hypothetical protein
MVFMSFVVLIAWFIWLDARRRREAAKAQAELQHRLLDKFSSPQEVGEFLQTEGGRRFLQGLTADRKHAGRRILLALQTGTVTTLLGLTTIGLGLLYPVRGAEPHPAIIMGALVLSLGAGFLLSAGISYRLSKAWGLLTAPNGNPAHP